MKVRQGVIPALCVSLAMTPGPAASSDAAKVIGGAILGIMAGQAVQGAQKRREQQRSRSSQRAYSPQRQRIREVQQALNEFGFSAGGADGIMGPKTRAAISNYQAYMGYPTTGHLNDRERSVLVEGKNRYDAGGAQAYPEVVANEGTKGLLKAFNDPNYVNRYRGGDTTGQAQTASVSTSGQGGGIGTGNGGVLPKLDLSRGKAPSSMATHCEVVAGLTQVNGGVILASDVSDPDQALGEQFCEARAYAITQGQSLLANARATEDQITNLCDQISDNMAPAVAAMGTQDVKVISAQAKQIANRIYNQDMAAAEGYGRICLGTGYRQDDAGMALGGALSMVAAGAMPYAEVMGHHLRWGFGADRAAGPSENWYKAGLTAMEHGAEPVFLPSKTAERNAIIKAALDAGTGTLAAEADGGGGGGLSLPELNLGD